MDPSHASLSFAPRQAPPLPSVQPLPLQIQNPQMSTELHPPLPMSFGPTPLDFSVGISTTCSQCTFIRTQDSGRASGTIRNVYDVVHGQHLPDKKIRDTSSQLVVGAWVRFTSPLPRADDAFDSDPWIRRHSTDAPKPKRHGWGAMQRWTGP